jgi:serine protease Do
MSYAAILLAGLIASSNAWGVETTAAPVKEDPAAHLAAIFAGDAPDGVDDLKAMQEHVKALTAKVLPSTVGVQIGQAWGSGVIVSKDGYVLTAAHVAGNANREAMFVLSDGRIVRGKTLGLNRGLDAGLMKITEKGEYPHVEMGGSKGVKEGQWCLAVGHPGGYQKERGLVVRLGRVLFTDGDAITSDCTLVGGDSGGPLFDMQGRVIGINSRIAGAITSNLHVPVDTYREGWDRLVKADVWGHLPGQEPVLGVRGVEDSTVAKIATVGQDSPAEEAGIKKGDVVTKFGDAEIGDFASLKKAVLDHDPGDKVAVKVKRGEEIVDISDRPF